MRAHNQQRAHSQVNKPVVKNKADLTKKTMRPEKPVTDINLVANSAASQITNTLNFAVAQTALQKPSSKQRQLSVEELVKERLKM